jgi:hypothetical protein
MTLLMHVLLARVTHVTWGDIARPQQPGGLCAIMVALGAWGTGYVMRSTVHAQSAWVLLAAQGLAAALIYVLFLLFAPLPDLRALVSEITHDLIPPSLKRLRVVRAVLALQGLANQSSPTPATGTGRLS